MAAANSNRDVSMTLSVQTLGADEIKKLQSTIAGLAKEGGDAAPEFQRLADEIGRIGDQAKALQTFEQLSSETAALAARQAEAATNASELKARLEALSATTADAAAKQRLAAQALDEAKAASRETRDALAQQTAQTVEAKNADANYAQTVSDLKLKKIEQRAAIESAAAALAKANVEVREAEKAENKLAASYERAARDAKQAESAIRANANSVQGAADAALDLGVGTDNVAETQAELTQALNRTGRAAEDLRDRVQRLADQERELLGIRAFEEQAAAAERLQTAGDYARLFEEALERLAETERALQQQQADERWQREAEAIVDAAHAAQELARQTAVLEAAQRELAAQDAFSQQLAEAARLRQAADYVRNYTEQLEAAERQAQETADAAAAATKEIADAFTTVGVRSAADLEAEIAKVRAAMSTLENQAGLTGGQLDVAFEAGNERIGDLEAQLREVNDEMTIGDKVAALFSNSIGQIAAGNLIADAVGSLVQKVKDMAAAFISTIVETQKLRAALFAVYGSTEQASKQFDFLRKTAMAAGVSIGDITPTFIKFSAATRSSGISLELTNKLFGEVARTAGVLGLSGESVTGMLEALGQMASKGVVSMEELRQQLGDRLPGALSLVAKGFDLTEAQLIKLVENGGLAAVDLFQALADELPNVKGEATGLAASWQRLTNAFSEAAVQGGDAGWLDLLSSTLQGVAIVVGPVVKALHHLQEGFFLVGKAAAIFLGPGLGDMETRLGLFTEEVEKMDTRIQKVGDSFDIASGQMVSASAAADKVTLALQGEGAAAAQATLSINKTALALEAQAYAANLAEQGTLSLSSQIVKFKVYIDTLVEAQKSQIDGDVKLAKAAKIQGDSLTALTELRGQDYLSMQAQIAASDKYAAALEKAAQSQLAELELLTLKRDEIIKNAEARNLDKAAVQTQVDEINKKIATSAAETEQTKQSSDAARQEADVRKLNAQAYKDNSAAIKEFKTAVDDAQMTLDLMVQGLEEGWSTQEQVTAATKRLAEATYLYNDAIKDSIAAIELQTRVQQANVNLAVTKLELEQRNYQSLAQSARASGDYHMALYYEIEARFRQIEVIKLSSAALKLEAEAMIKALEIERAALDLSDPMLKAKQAEIDIRLANAKAKLLEANAGEQAISAIEREISALRDAELARDRDSNSRDKNTASINRQTEALTRNSGAQYDAENFRVGPDGKRVEMTGPSRRSVHSQAKAAGLSDKEAMQIATQFVSERGEAVGQNGSMSWQEALNNAINDAWERNMNPRALNNKNYGSAGTGTPQDAMGNGTTQTMNINIGGRSTAVKLVGKDDANALTSVLRQLESAASSSNGGPP